MDELSTAYSGDPSKRKHSRLATRQSVSPALRRRGSANSLQSHAMSDSDQSDIIAPIPRKHINSESLRWMHTPSPEPQVSMGPRNHTFPSKRGAPRFSSFSLDPLQHSAIQKSLSKDSTGKEKDVEHGAARRWLRWMHKNGLKAWIVPCIVVTTTWIKLCTSLGSYSGQGMPPLFGDYEAQRHWMELTIHLPVKQWYTYDLQYWGLDYPPLTAYVSWICGQVGTWINPTWFVLDESRGIETAGSKLFMRSSVIAFDLIYVCAVIMFARVCQTSRSAKTQNITLITLLAQPALLLIDHGHFQYNSVMLGFTLLCLNYLSTGQDTVAAVFFVASLGFKQMALYYAPAIGSYLLGKCIYLGPSAGRRLFIRLAITTIVTFTILFLPFLPPFSSPKTILDPITRIFPFSRGLFEDKVANFWCFSNVAVKWRNRASSEVLVKLATLLTTIGFLPSVLGLLRSAISLQAPKEKTKEASAPGAGPLFPLLTFALLSSSLSFFLFSFQVHEKTILVPLMPLTLIMTSAVHYSTPWEIGMLGNNVAVFSMWPLLKRDGLAVQYIAMLVLWNAALGYSPFRKPKSFIQYMSLVVSIVCVALHIIELLIPPPSRYPDIYPVLNVLVSTPVFIFIWLWSIKCGMEAGWALSGIGRNSLDTGDWERERERRASTMSRGRVASVASSSGSASVVGLGMPPLEREGSSRMRHQSLGVAHARKRLGSSSFTPPAMDLSPDVLDRVPEPLKTR